MSISFSVLDSGNVAFSGGSFSTASVSPGGDKLILYCIAACFNTDPGSDAVLSVSGNGLTGSRIIERRYGTAAGRRTMAIFRAMGASPSSGTVTVSSSSAATEQTATYKIIEVSGVKTTGTNGADAVDTAHDDSASNVSPIGTTVTTTPDTGDVSFSIWAGEDGVSTLNSDALWATLGTDLAGTDTHLRTDYDDGQDLSPTWTFTPDMNAGAATILLKAAAAGGGPTGPPAGSWMSMGVGV